MIAERALHIMLNDDWARASAMLQALRTEMSCAQLENKARHDVENLLAISQSNLEAASEGVLEPTPERLENIQRALASAKRLLKS
jgi:hypothetical protein